jgi:signal transduction histidine kinase
MAQEKSLVFSIDRCDDVTANVDKTTIQQLFSNLIDNAVKFTPERESIVLSLVQQNGAVEFRVKDTGKGIAPEEIPKIFERFYQVDASRSDPARGSGLGLQICKRIVEAHGGTIAIEQNGDRGVTFVVRLPLAE